MGTPVFSQYILEKLIENGFNVIGLVSQPDRPVGRKKIITPTPTKEVALKYGLPIYQPERIKDDYEFIKELNPDVIITCAYGQFVPQGLLDIPLMFILVDTIGEFGVLWATPIAESLSVFVALGLLLSFLVKESKKHKNELNLEIQ